MLGNEYQVGDRVRLRHRPNHPPMVVSEVYTPDYYFRYQCRWSDGWAVQTQVFKADDLIPAARTATGGGLWVPKMLEAEVAHG